MVITSCFPCNWLAFLSVYERIAFFEEGENLSPTLNWANYLPFSNMAPPRPISFGVQILPGSKKKDHDPLKWGQSPPNRQECFFCARIWCLSFIFFDNSSNLFRAKQYGGQNSPPADFRSPYHQSQCFWRPFLNLARAQKVRHFDSLTFLFNSSRNHYSILGITIDNVGLIQIGLQHKLLA